MKTNIMKSWKTSRKMINVNCIECDALFEKTESEYKRSVNKQHNHFCSKKCALDFRFKNSISLCKNCGTEIKSKKFCSQSCAAIYNNKKRIGEKRNFSEEGKENINNAQINRFKLLVENYEIKPNFCKECNIKLQYKFRKRKFCSIDCKRTYDRKNLTEYQKYYKDCQFKFGLSEYPNEFDFNLIKEYGWYHAKNHGNNLNGVSRDHMVSIKYGYEHNIDSKIIKHPANCNLLKHNENASKHKSCSITLDELLTRIKMWNVKYGALTQSA